jgi:hypothetical protein
VADLSHWIRIGRTKKKREMDLTKLGFLVVAGEVRGSGSNAGSGVPQS